MSADAAAAADGGRRRACCSRSARPGPSPHSPPPHLNHRLGKEQVDPEDVAAWAASYKAPTQLKTLGAARSNLFNRVSLDE